MLDFIFSVIGTLLYPLFSIIFVLLDIAQNIFRAFAGVGEMGITDLGLSITAKNDGGETSTGIVYYFMQSDLTKNLLISIALLAIFLLIVFTVMAFIKNAYSSKPKNWKDIVGNAIKGLANFIFIPVCCLLGVWLGNILLNAVDGATSTGGATIMSRKVFMAAAYNANKIRSGNHPGQDSYEDYAKMVWEDSSLRNKVGEDGKKIEFKTGQSQDYYADLIDTIFMQSDYTESTNINIYWQGAVAKGYNLWEINYLVLIVVGIFMLSALISLAYAMIRRLFLILFMFVVSPALCAMYPLDEGKAVGSYKNEFIKHVLSAYGAVAGMNLFMSFLPIIDKISLTNMSASWLTGTADLFVQILVMVTGLYVVKEFIGTLSGWIGSEDALSKGESARKQTKGAMKSFREKTGKFAKGVAKFKGKYDGIREQGGVRAMYREMRESMLKGALKGVTGIDADDTRKEYFKQRKEGIEHSDTRREHQLEEYNEARSTAQFQASRGAADTAIATARSAGRDLTTEEMADILRPIQDKEAKKRVATLLAQYRNEYAMANNRNTTTVDKVLESEDKVVKEENARQSAYGSSSDYTNTFVDYNIAEADMAGYETANAMYATFNNDDGTTSLTQVSDEDLEASRMAAEKGGAAEEAIYQANVLNNRIIKEYRDLFEKRQQKEREVKSQATSLADSIEKLADNYNGTNKGLLTTAANNIRAAVNDPSATTTSINNAITAARGTLTAEMINILDTGHR